MELKTDVRINLNLHFTSDDLANGAELARLAAVCDGLYMLAKAGGQEPPSGLRTAPAIEAAEAEPADIEEPAEPEPVEDQQPRPQRRGSQMPASRGWEFEQFDRAVREEAKRLSVDGKMPTTTHWDRYRSPDLPTMTGVIRRYGVRNTVGLAERLGYEPVRPTRAAPQRTKQADVANTNGHAGRHL